MITQQDPSDYLQLVTRFVLEISREIPYHDSFFMQK